MEYSQRKICRQKLKISNLITDQFLKYRCWLAIPTSAKKASTAVVLHRTTVGYMAPVVLVQLQTAKMTILMLTANLFLWHTSARSGFSRWKYVDSPCPHIFPQGFGLAKFWGYFSKYIYGNCDCLIDKNCFNRHHCPPWNLLFLLLNSPFCSFPSKAHSVVHSHKAPWPIDKLLSDLSWTGIQLLHCTLLCCLECTFCNFMIQYLHQPQYYKVN